MMRQIAVIFLLLAFGAQTFNGAVMVLDYYVNKASFVQNCENKARPLLHCNGQCQLMKKIKAAEKKEQQNPERKGENKNEVISSRSFFASLFIRQINIHPAFSSYYSAFIPKGISSGIFHPPALV